MKKKALFSLLLCFLLLLPSCAILSGEEETEKGGIDISAVEFTSTNITVAENDHSGPGVGGYAMRKTMEMTETARVTYAFEPQISPEDRKLYIDTTEGFLDAIGIDQRIAVNLYLPRSYEATFVKSNSIYTYQADPVSREYVCALLWSLFGDYANYGLISGYAGYLLSALYGMPWEMATEGDWAPTGNTDHLDLNLLCFREGFVSREQAGAAARIANSFTAAVLDENGKEGLHLLLSKSGQVSSAEKFAAVLSDFYKTKGIDYTPSALLYHGGGKVYEYFIKSQYATFCIEQGWYDRLEVISPWYMEASPLLYKGIFHQNYTDIKSYFTLHTKQMGQYQELFGMEPYNNDLTVYLPQNDYLNSEYRAVPHIIILTSVNSLMHEYIHAVTKDQAIREWWTVEGFARYYERYYNDFSNELSSLDYNYNPEVAEKGYIQKFKAALGRDIDVASDDMIHLANIRCLQSDLFDPNADQGYIPGCAFIGYLISRFGEEQVLEIILKTGDFGEYTYEELVADWKAYVQETYADYALD